MLLGVVQVVVDAHHHRQVLAPRRRGDYDLLGPAGQVAPGLLGVGEDARGLDYQVDSHFAPGNRTRVPLGEHLDGAAVHDQVAVVRFHSARVTAVAGVPLEQVRVGLGVGEVIDRGHLHLAFIPLLVGPEHQPADSSESVNANSRDH